MSFFAGRFVLINNFSLQTGEMEVKNPLFLDDPTPASQPQPHSASQQTPQETSAKASSGSAKTTEESAKKSTKKN